MQQLKKCLLVALLSATGCALAQEPSVRVLMTTTAGDLEIELFVGRAPVTAGNFLKLVDAGALDGGAFYRVVNAANDKGDPKITVIQGGLGDAGEGFAAIGHETTRETGIRHEDGVISMARGEVGTASTEFFICIGEQPGLDFGQPRNADGQGFAAFGRVVKGMQVARAINALPAEAPSDSAYTVGQMLTQPVRILEVRRIEY